MADLIDGLMVLGAFGLMLIGGYFCCVIAYWDLHHKARR